METAMVEFYHLGHEAFGEGRYDEAKQFFTKLMAMGCRFADVVNLLGVIAFERSDWITAATYFREALEINPRYTEACLNLAVTLNEMGDYEAGEAAFQTACQASAAREGQLDPFVKGRLSNLHADIAEIYHGLGHHEEAVAEYGKALSLGPTFPDLRTRLGVLLRDMGDYEGAIAEFTRVRQEHPHYAAAAIQLGITYYGRGQVELADDEWNSLLARDPTNAQALMYLKLVEKDRS